MSESNTWVTVQPPKKKADWRFKNVRLLELPPEQNLKGGRAGQTTLPLEKGVIVKILTRRNAKETWSVCSVPDVSNWGDVRVLELEWNCPFCGSVHRFFIPETWIAGGKAEFVEVAA